MAVDKNIIYTELLKLKLDLEYKDIPTPSYIIDLITKCRSFLIKVEKYMIETTMELDVSKRQFRVEKLNLDIKKRQALINNDRIKKLPSIKEREAAVDELLESDYKNLLDIENNLASLENLASSIKTVYYNLKDTNGDIKTLLSIMKEQINHLNMGLPTDPGMKALADNLGELDQMEKEMTADDVQTSTEYQTEETGSATDQESSIEEAPAADAQGDSDDTISSFLGEDSIESEKSDSDESDNKEEEEKMDDAAPQKSQAQPGAPEIEIDLKGDTEEASTTEFDLGDFGIEISTDDEVPVTSTSKSAAPAKEIEPIEAPLKAKEAVVSKEPSGTNTKSSQAPKEEKVVPNKKTCPEDLDIDELLASLD